MCSFFYGVHMLDTEYIGIYRFGMSTLLFNFIPVVGLLFSFTNTVGAALWAAQLEAEANIIDNPVSGSAQGRK